MYKFLVFVGALVLLAGIAFVFLVSGSDEPESQGTQVQPSVQSEPLQKLAKPVAVAKAPVVVKDMRTGDPFVPSSVEELRYSASIGCKSVSACKKRFLAALIAHTQWKVIADDNGWKLTVPKAEFMALQAALKGLGTLTLTTETLRVKDELPTVDCRVGFIAAQGNP